MATKDMAYDHPQYTVSQFIAAPVKAVAASTLALILPFTYATTIKKISVAVNVAGTNASAGYDIYNGTTSVGSITLGTDPARTIESDLLQDISIAAGGYLEFRTKANSATMAGDAVIEHRPTPGSSVSA